MNSKISNFRRKSFEGLVDLALERIRKKILDENQDLKTVFKKWDANGDGTITYDEFTKQVREIDETISGQQIYEMMCRIDKGTDI